MINTTFLVEGGAKKISEQFNMPFLGEIPLNSGIMSGSDSGKPIMISNPDSPSAVAFRKSAKNIAAQCSILHQNYKKKWHLKVKMMKLPSENVLT